MGCSQGAYRGQWADRGQWCFLATSASTRKFFSWPKQTHNGSLWSDGTIHWSDGDIWKRDNDNPPARWGSLVQGTDTGDGWLETEVTIKRWTPVDADLRHRYELNQTWLAAALNSS